MATFDAAIDFVLANEGGDLFVDAATGEYSKYGITLQLALECRACTPENGRAFIEGLNVISAIAFYRRYVWPGIFYSIRDQRVATKLFDLVVNEGEVQAVRLIQRACNECGGTLSPDGNFGSFTLAEVNSLDPARLLTALCAEAVAFYAGLVKRFPDKFLKYAKEWEERAQRKP